ncbi:1,4-dihydroxy-2-naphthoate octaprenyltransferase [Bizionia gelidisalsuginis]|uniref:1,4-dihydroxy-2-naphthoate octaprenyltransferase n=2 Tax=Bizionia TaxID=283785 RepID=A0A8H2LDJ3_9FLAO|nr:MULTISPECIES: 1,4-dihydroxy-2-naphthoate octaprenyltransferase [Bizionia]TYB73081.1 1,4-dihydroxy-2-naphthoate octaprenyltransferase [Bizionia saleffrena]TYC14851.1 1,4-dihydroxy-2-naphthoate octaprenyltransferase [Bizionia gelidisalsuginis]
MNRFSIWLSAIRLRTLPLSISGIIVAGCLAEYNGVFDWLIFLLAILVTLSYQILSNLANDYGDGVKGTDNNDRIGPQRVIQSGAITPKSMLNAIRLNVFISIILTILLIFMAFGSENLLLILLFFVLGILSVIAAIKYTVGDSAYGYKGLGDIFVFIFFGLVSVIGGYFLFAKQIDHVTFLPAISIGLLSAGVLNLNNMRDIESDIKSNKITKAVKLGVKRSKNYHYFLVVGALISSFVFGVLYYTSPFNLVFILAYVPIIKHIITVKNNTRPRDLDSELKKLALSTVLLSLLLGVGHLF